MAFLRGGPQSAGGEAENEKALSWGIPSTGWSDEVALLLYLHSPPTSLGHDAYLTFARKNDAWAKRTLGTTAHLYYTSWIDDPKKSPFYDPATGRACKPSRLDIPPPPRLPSPPPNVCTWVFVMNQGLMIGSDLLFYRAAGDEKLPQKRRRDGMQSIRHGKTRRVRVQWQAGCQSILRRQGLEGDSSLNSPNCH